MNLGEQVDMARRGKSGDDVLMLQAALVGLEQMRQNTEKKIAEIRLRLGSGNGVEPVAFAEKPRRTLSAAARRRIASAQRKRWAAARQEAKPKRVLSAAARRRIGAAQRKRWAGVRVAQAKAPAAKPAVKAAARAAKRTA
jgi:hypothetical protein